MGIGFKGWKRRNLLIWWSIGWFFWVLLLFYPISYGILRLALVMLAVVLWLGMLGLFWHQLWVRLGCLVLAGVVGAIALLPGPPPDSETLRQDYVQALNAYTGTTYVWGGETRLGIDCSGLVRRGLVDANLKRGLLTLNPHLIRQAISLWWYDASAQALGEEYRDLTRRIGQADSINQIDPASLQPGDIAVTVDGVHVLAYTGNNIWIEADPHHKRTIRVKVPDFSNPWFQVPVQILQWRQFVDVPDAS